jgi:hypothetical protein
MSQYKKAVSDQKKRLQEEKADNNRVLHYFQKGAGEHYRLTRYESGREVIETFNQDD